MRILLDAMGGDNAPKATIEGALEYAKDTTSKIVLVGKKEVIEENIVSIVGSNWNEKYNNIEIMDARETIEMEDVPTKAIKEKKDSSMVVALNMLKNDEADVLVSAGNTGALLTRCNSYSKRDNKTGNRSNTSLYRQRIYAYRCRSKYKL